ncbi:hypothetical protein FEM48_Zijuj10G0084000 [Ziziphus jujuba var. spinosa]|uniref:EF-hand domain-containing protein n=1 Tax=Ziziphus jujuba var. spinosa TaxID=714518 RepID=A0A978UMB1_ZIZJJ|nr:hypothetical protein FEM48_Zijuj10G0084000 [Ziziphus jujuba var. spinosa]
MFPNLQLHHQLGYPDHFPMEEKESNTISTISHALPLLLRLLLGEIILNNLLSSVKLFVRPPLKFVSTRWKVWTERLKKIGFSLGQPINNQHQSSFGTERIYDGKLSKEEVQMVMGRLGIFYIAQGDDSQERVGAEELTELFAEEEPNLEEVKEAFDVFDENKDGFIEAEELQSVLCRLGLSEYSGISKCSKMIKTVDKNEDGMIDFNEFVKLLENC